MVVPLSVTGGNDQQSLCTTHLGCKQQLDCHLSQWSARECISPPSDHLNIVVRSDIGAKLEGLFSLQRSVNL